MCNKIKQILHLQTTLSANPPPLCKADSGASKHYIRELDEDLLDNVVVDDGPAVTLPDKSILKSNKSGFIPVPQLSQKARQAHIIPGLTNSSLLSMGQLCDDNC